jgi:protein-tyrosine phosphatase
MEAGVLLRLRKAPSERAATPRKLCHSAAYHADQPAARTDSLSGTLGDHVAIEVLHLPTQTPGSEGAGPVPVRLRAHPDVGLVVPGLWVGAAPGRRQALLLAREGINAVVDLRSERAKADDVWPPEVELVHVGLEDHGSPTAEELRAAAQAVSALMHRGRNVLVHCRAGLERGPTVACATLILQGWPLNNAYRRVVESRPQALPTDGQLAALQTLANTRGRG